MTRAELIAALEKAEEPSRALDAEIAEFLGHRIAWHPGGSIQNANGGPVIQWQKPHPYAGMKEPCPYWTSSIDAALTLMPSDDHYMWAVGTVKTSGPYAANICPGDTDGRPTYQGATPAIALCIAALKAGGE